MLIGKLCAALQAGPEAYNKAQYRANQLVAAAGVLDTKCAVAGLVWVSDLSFGCKNTSYTVRIKPAIYQNTCNCM